MRVNDQFGAAFTIADNGYMGMVLVSLLDLISAAEITQSVIIPFTRGKLDAPPSSEFGNFAFEGKGLSLRFIRQPGKRLIEVDWPAFAAPRNGSKATRSGGENKPSILDGKRCLKGSLSLSQPPMDSMVTATPFPNKETAFYYNQKINCMDASGKLTFGGQVFEFKSIYGPWSMKSDDGRLHLVFTPILDRAADTNLLLRSNQHQVFGRYSGSAILDNGHGSPLFKLCPRCCIYFSGTRKCQ